MTLGMANWKLIVKILGILLFMMAGLLVVCMGVSVFYHESVLPFLLPVIIAVTVASATAYGCKDASRNMGRRDGYIVVSVSWLLFSALGMLPYLFSGTITDTAGAFLESMSGFSSTGSTVIDDIDSVPKGILFWRSMTQWVGGIGIIFFTIAILPAFGVGEIKLFAAESTGPMHDKVHPRISVAARWIGTVYLGLTVMCAAALMLCGMGAFDAVNHAMTTTATGGFSTHSALLSDVYGSAGIEYVLTLFMFVSGINYTLVYYTILKGRFKRFVQDSELRYYATIIASATLICTISLVLRQGQGGLEQAFRHAFFTVVSIQTTTGFGTCDYTAWPTQLLPIILFIMFVGACSGSTSGGFKCIRISMLDKVMKNELTRILHPRAVMPVKVNGNVVPTSAVKTLTAFFALNIMVLALGTFILKLCGADTCACIGEGGMAESFSLALSSLSNIGPGIGYYGPTHSWATLTPMAKYVCSFMMLIGRLEIFPVIILFTRSFWKNS